MNFGKIRSGLGFQNNKSDSYNEIEFVENFQSKLFYIFSDYTILDKNDNLIPELFTISARFGKGNKTQLGNKTSVNKYKLEIGKKFSDKREKMDIELLTLLLLKLNLMLVLCNIKERLCIITTPFVQLNFSNFDSSLKPFNSSLQM